MADNNDVTPENKRIRRLRNKSMENLSLMIDQLSTSLYGTTQISKLDALDKQFQQIIQDELSSLSSSASNNDITSFIGQLYNNVKIEDAGVERLLSNLDSFSGSNIESLSSMFDDVYKNRLLMQADLHQVASQLIELSEAILITRDAITSSDVVEGRMSRKIEFVGLDEKESNKWIPVVENMEKNLDILKKIKNFIIPNTLEYGEYYVYTIPYSELFAQFDQYKKGNGVGHRIYREETLDENLKKESKTKLYTESTTQSSKTKKDEDKFYNEWYDKVYNEFILYESKKEDKITSVKTNTPSKKDFINDMKEIMNRVSVCNEEVPLPILEYGYNGIEKLRGEQEVKKNAYETILTEDTDEENNDETPKKKVPFGEIKDCYVKYLDPTTVLPVEMMGEIFGYYRILSDDVMPLSGMVSSTLYYNRFDADSRHGTVVDEICQRIIQSFDEDFLKNNINMKKLIAEAINYYNLNDRKIKFQFIPADRIHRFKIDEDIDGHGTSMIKKSLFYAKLYLMLLLFKIMSIVLYSNDQKVNYVRSSGIDKDISAKIQEIIRRKQARTINIMDLFSYSTLINKIGNGTETYIPVGRNDVRGVETEILSGQDIQLNSDLMDALKTSYILGTGVPNAIINYLNEADFAKTIELNNSKFLGRVVNYQLDFNPDITEMYKNLMRHCTNIPEHVINCFNWYLQPPKSQNNTIKQDLLGYVDSLTNFLVNIYYGDNAADPENAEQVKQFKRLVAEDQLPQLPFNEFDQMVTKAKLKAEEAKLIPNPDNGGSDDLELTDEDLKL